MIKFSILCLLFLSNGIVSAQVFKKIDPSTGHVTLTNIPPKSLNQGSGENSAVAQTTGKKDVVKAKISPVNFPKLNPEIQKDRDSDRRKILEEELKTEQIALKNASEKKLDLDVISRHKVNIAALEREIGSIK